VFGGRTPFKITSKSFKYPLYARPRTSDLQIFNAIFAEGEYRHLEDLRDVRLVIDCGANVGYSSIYFLSRFPECVVIAVEADPENYEILRRNLSPYRERAKAIHAGVWSHQTNLKISDVPYRGRQECSRQVVECGPDESSSFPAVSIGELLEGSGYDRISLLKVDIEGAEAVVFAANYEYWIDRTDNIAIEIHDDAGFGDARGSFARAIAGRGFSMSHSSDLTFCRRPPA
jgi:FkbM family methyltransferase